jgi:hypothetical protein
MWSAVIDDVRQALNELVHEGHFEAATGAAELVDDQQSLRSSTHQRSTGWGV